MIFLMNFLAEIYRTIWSHEKSQLTVILEYRVYDSLGSFVLMRKTMTSHVAAKP